MKKFLIFLVAIVVVVCFGVTTYYFLRNDETITLSKSSLQINEGGTFSLRAKDYTGLGLTVTKQHRKTKYGYKVYKVENGKKTDVTDGDYIVYDAKADTYTAVKGGQYIFTITTTNKKYKEFNVDLTVGNGVDAPYFIRTADELNKYLNTNDNKDVNKDAVLLNNITLGDGFTGLPKYVGNFDGNGKTISGLKITGTDTNAGLFKAIGGEATVSNLTIYQPVINGSFSNAGALAGTISNNAVISGVQIKQADITNTNATGVTGGLAGTISDDALIAVSYTDSANIKVNDATSTLAVDSKTVGGLVGVNDKADIKASYAKDVVIPGNGNAGGLVGEFIVEKSYESGSSTTEEFKNNGTIQQSYATGVTSNDMGSFLGKLTDNGTVKISKDNSEPYSYLVGNYAKNGQDQSLIKNTDGASDLYQALTQAAGSSKPNYVNNLPEDKQYKLYNDVPWQANLWDFTNETPSLKLENGISADNTISPDMAYFAGARTPREVNSDGSDLDTALKSTNKGDQNITLKHNEAGYELSEQYDFTNRTLIGEADAEGNLPVIKVKNGLFKDVKNSSISNIIVEVSEAPTEGDTYGAVANTIADNTSISNVTVKYSNELTIGESTTTFGGLVGKATDSTISNCSVEGLNIKSSAIQNFGGLVANSQNTSISINGNSVTATINTTAAANIGGVAASNTKEILGADDNNLAVTLNVASVGGNSNISAITADNNGTISNIKLNAEVKFPNSSTHTINVAGMAVNNYGKISQVYLEQGNLGEEANSQVDNNHIVAGSVVYAQENSTVSQVTVKANIYGNLASGIVYQMMNTSATFDQVYVGNNTIAGKKYVAGMAIYANFGTIKNVQLVSNLKGYADTTRTSLLVMDFESNGTIDCVTVNSSIDANCKGVIYRETAYRFSADDGVEDGSAASTGYKETNNIFGDPGTNVGKMTNVVINIGKASESGKAITKCMYIGAAWDFNPGHGATSTGINFVQTLSNDDFANSENFKGNFHVELTKDNTKSKSAFSSNNGYDYTLQFNLSASADTIWQEVPNAGIQLTFLKNI